MALVNPAAANAQEAALLGSAIGSVQNNISQLVRVRNIVTLMTDGEATSAFGIAARQTFIDRVAGAVTIAENASGASLAGLWGRCYELCIKQSAAIDPTAAAAAATLKGTLEALYSVMTTLRSLSVKIEDWAVDSNVTNATIAARFGVANNANAIGTLRDRLKFAAALIDNNDGSAITDPSTPEQLFNQLIYGTIY